MGFLVGAPIEQAGPAGLLPGLPELSPGSFLPLHGRSLLCRLFVLRIKFSLNPVSIRSSAAANDGTIFSCLHCWPASMPPFAHTSAGDTVACIICACCSFRKHCTNIARAVATHDTMPLDSALDNNPGQIAIRKCKKHACTRLCSEWAMLRCDRQLQTCLRTSSLVCVGN